jgi:hypothetical protein
MFDRMQFIIEYPNKMKWGEYKAGIWDIDGKSLGNILYKGFDKKQHLRFEDDQGICHGTLTKSKIKSLSNWTECSEIFGPLEDLRGRIEIPYWGNLRRSKFSTYCGPRILFDVSGHMIASSGTFTYDGLGSFGAFEYLRKNGLDFKTPEGAIIATIRNSKGYPGCRVDLFPPILDTLSIFSLVVHILTL